MTWSRTREEWQALQARGIPCVTVTCRQCDPHEPIAIVSGRTAAAANEAAQDVADFHTATYHAQQAEPPQFWRAKLNC